jgi:cytochrome c2
MPATEQTWRNIKILHVVFGVSGLALLLTTVWMLAADHDREAKDLQKQFNIVEARSLEWRKTEQETAKYEEAKQQLEAKLKAERSQVPSRQAVDGFLTTAETKPNNGYDFNTVRKKYEELTAATDVEQKIKYRAELLGAMQKIVDRAAYIENEAQRKLKFTKAELDVDMSALAIEIDESAPPEKIAATEAKVKKVRDEVETTLTPAYQDAKTHRLTLLSELTALRAGEADVQKELDKHESDVKRTETAYLEKAPNAGKWLLTLPILDAFGGPLKPQQTWLPELTWNNNFKNVARFDRCITCHQGIDKTSGSATNPAYNHEFDFVVKLDTPKTEPTADDFSKPLNERLRDTYGLMLASEGLLDPDDVTIEAVFSGGVAIKAGLQAGDILESIGGVTISSLDEAKNYLLQSVAWGKPLSLGIRRGVPHPYASHPRLDLYLGSLSPHKIGEFGCTICHEGQGNGTAFKWVSHTPNDPEQAASWTKDWGWFNNHHWIYPMLPKRFEEANCLKCHHDVTELKPSERFPDPPAPKLVKGFETIQDIGCFGCHEINGYDGPSKRRGPDLRAEPNYAMAAEQVLADKALTGANVAPELARIASLATQAVSHPESTRTRKLLAELINADAKVGADGKSAPKLAPETRAVAGILGADDETPGQYRKVGPSLRYVKSKNDEPFLFTWIKQPNRYRPSTKMPQFFGLYDHLHPAKRDEKGQVVVDGHGHPVLEESPGLKDAQRFEPLEILATTKYLLNASQPFTYLPKVEGAAAGDVARGKIMFQTRGCLACHSHQDFPGVAQNQGPNLSGLGAKLTDAKGADWLYTWIKQPTKYHNRTVMPNLFLDPITVETKDAEGKVTGTTKQDPAADIVAYLLAQKEIAPGKTFTPETLPQVKDSDLDELLSLYLSGAFTQAETKEVLKKGIPSSRKNSIKGDEQLLVTDGPLSQEQKLLYLGKKTIGRLGCAGCHDVPGFEDAKPIGTGLADWGRKEPSKLAFEQVAAYLGEKDAHGHGEQSGPPDLDKGYYMDALGHHQREGFLWQKLREPRSYDFKKTENKSYIDRLRMPLFTVLNDGDREAIMTFVLGLVAEPPPAKYVYKPSPKMGAMLAGQRVIEKFNCAGCHALEMQRWDIDYKPGSIQAPSTADEYAFLVPHFTPDQIAKSKQVDRRGLGHATLHGLPMPKEDEEEPETYFKLWQPTLIDGQTWLAGGTDVAVNDVLNPPATTVAHPQLGGILANYLHPVATALEKKNNPNVKGSDVWGFLPPPLHNEGAKVQTQWLHDFLLDPYPIRPAAILRMPKFNLTSAESEAIVGYFAARDGMEYPYEFDARTRSSAVSAPPQIKRLDDAMKLVTDNNYCVKCHKIGDFSPNGAPAALAPNLADVSKRIRPEFLRDWIANPARLLPYTGMPVNFPKNKPADQALFPGTAEEQVNAIVDLLLNYDALMTGKTSIKPLVKPAAPAGAPAAPATPPPPATGGGE